jgi:hypothetical protein
MPTSGLDPSAEFACGASTQWSICIGGDPPKHPVDLSDSASFTIDQIARDVEAKIKANAAKAGPR